MPRHFRCIAILVAVLFFSISAQAQNRAQVNQEARAIFKQLVEINTTDSTGDVTQAAEAMAKRFRDAGFPEKDLIVAAPMIARKISFCASGAPTKLCPFSSSGTSMS